MDLRQGIRNDTLLKHISAGISHVFRVLFIREFKERNSFGIGGIGGIGMAVLVQQQLHAVV